MNSPAIMADIMDPVMMERFMPPVKTAAIMANAINPNSGIWKHIFCRFVEDRNFFGDRTDITIKTSTKIRKRTISLRCDSFSLFKNITYSSLNLLHPPCRHSFPQSVY